MSSITIGGLAPGLDTNSILTQLLDLERLPQKLMQAKQKTYKSQSDTYTKVKTSLTDLQTLMKGMNTGSSFKEMSSTVADSTVLTATASSSASAGIHTLEVITLATSQRQVSAGYADDVLFNTGAFTVDDGAGTVTSIDITDSNNSLEGMVSAINSSGANVTASIINDGSSTPNRLVITGKDTGNYTVDFSGLSGPGATGSDPAPTLLDSTDASYQAGAPATFKLDGITISKTSNTVTDALSGVTLNLLKQGATTTFTVANDTTGITDKIDSFVTAYNTVITLINTQSKYDATNKSAGVLSGDSTLRTIQSRLQTLLTSTVTGVDSQYTTLAQLGITSDESDGTLSVDSDMLSDALSNDFDGVVDLFTHNTGTSLSLATNEYGIAQQFNLSIESMVASAVSNGLIETRIQGLQSSISDIDKRVSANEERVTNLQISLQKQFSAMELMVSKLQTQGSSMLSALNASSFSTTSK